MPKFQDLIQRVPESVRRVLPPLCFAVVFGTVALVLAHRWRAEQIRALEAEKARLMENYPEPIEVVVAAQDLPEGTTLEAPHLRMGKVPPLFVQPYAVRVPDQLVGLVTVAPIAKNEQVLTNKLRKPEQQKPVVEGLSSLTPEGNRAVTIVVDTVTGVGGFVRPGDKVDVLWSPQGSNQQGNQAVTVTLFQDVPVLAVGNQMVGGTKGEGAADNQQTVTLALGPQESSLLLFARQQGQLQLTLRPRTDHGEVHVVPADMGLLMQKVLGAIQQQQEKAPEGREVEVFRGLERNVVVLPPAEHSSANGKQDHP